MQTEKEMDLMTSGVDMHAGSGQFIIDAYVRKACKYLIARLASQNRVNVENFLKLKQIELWHVLTPPVVKQ